MSGIIYGIMTRLEKRPSKLFSRIEVQILLNTTARAFNKKGKCVIFSRDALKKYAEYTLACMQDKADKKRLYEESYKLGAKIKKLTGFTKKEDLQRLVFFLYSNIGITMTGELPGEITVLGCYFSRVYSPENCSLISAMDSGIISGICGEGTLNFIERITEGCQHCMAYMTRNT